LYIRDIRFDAEMIVNLSGLEPNWEILECAEDFSRCRHYAWRHGLLPQTSNLSTRTWLGLQPLEFHDAIGFVIGGKRYKATGTGGNSSYMMRSCQKLPRDVWVSAVVAGNGRRLDVPVANITKKGYTPYPGVTWIYPPTKKIHHETKVWGGKG
jgi:hypothetical protein